MKVQPSENDLVRPFSACPEFTKLTKRRKCVICHKNCSHYCVSCSNVLREQFVAVHNPVSHGNSPVKDCFFQHSSKHHK
jgi:hypothetical protein